MLAILVMYVIPIVMIPVVPLIGLVLLVGWGQNIALAFTVVAVAIGVTCWMQYRAGKQEWVKAHPGKRWILTHGTLGGSLVLLVLALLCFLMDFSVAIAGNVDRLGFGIAFGCFFLILSFCTARGYKKFRKSPRSYKKWIEEQNRNNKATKLSDVHMSSDSIATAGGWGTSKNLAE